MQPSPQQQTPPPPGSSYPSYGYSSGTGGISTPMINKRMIFAIIVLGALLLWIAQLALRGFAVSDTGVRNFFRALAYTGAVIGLGGGVLGALGSPRTDGHQNLGLLVLAGFFLMALASGF